jgi:hypothetical protein
VKVHALTLFALMGACDVTPGCPCNLATPCLGCEPKAKVATSKLSTFIFFSNQICFEKSRAISYKHQKVLFNDV